jgi:hypothetical protein
LTLEQSWTSSANSKPTYEMQPRLLQVSLYEVNDTNDNQVYANEVSEYCRLDEYDNSKGNRNNGSDQTTDYGHCEPPYRILAAV